MRKTLTLHLDSSQREPGTTPAEPTFNLSRDLCNVHSIAVKHVAFGNTIHNVRLGSNDKLQLTSDTGATFNPVTYITPGFYSSTEYVTQLNASLATFFSTADVMVTLNTANSTLLWTLPTGGGIENAASNASTTLGLAKSGVSSGTFTSQLFLGSPFVVGYQCMHFNQSDANVFGGGERKSDCFFLQPLNSGYGNIESYSPNPPPIVRCGGATLSSLSFRVLDPITGLLLDEIQNWFMSIDVVVTN
jgi:hypothetical protein